MLLIEAHQVTRLARWLALVDPKVGLAMSASSCSSLRQSVLAYQLCVTPLTCMMHQCMLDESFADAQHGLFPQRPATRESCY